MGTGVEATPAPCPTPLAVDGVDAHVEIKDAVTLVPFAAEMPSCTDVTVNHASAVVVSLPESVVLFVTLCG